MENKRLLEETKLLDYSNQEIQDLVKIRKWKNFEEEQQIKAIYNYVRDEIMFGYNVDDNIPASKVLSDGYGQCNTKGTLFMALLRAVGIPCRVHGFTIDKKLQKGAMTGIVYKNAPKNVFHSWVEQLLLPSLPKDIWINCSTFIVNVRGPFVAMGWQ